MTLRVIGAGLGRTGTHSLMNALSQILGGPCYHMFVVTENPSHIETWHNASLGKMPDWNEFFKEYKAAVDWPVSAFWPEISTAFPDALILHSIRDPGEWWISASNTIFAKSEGRSPEFTAMLDQMFENRFTNKRDDRQASIEAFNAHNANVRETVPPHRLLEWKVGDGWEPICSALNLPVPSNPFPHTNSTEEFVARRNKRAIAN